MPDAIALALEGFDRQESYYDRLGLITGANNSIYIDDETGEYVISGRISTMPKSASITEIYRGKDRKRAVEVANEMIRFMKTHIADLEKEKKETFEI